MGLSALRTRCTRDEQSIGTGLPAARDRDAHSKRAHPRLVPAGLPAQPALHRPPGAYAPDGAARVRGPLAAPWSRSWSTPALRLPPFTTRFCTQRRHQLRRSNAFSRPRKSASTRPCADRNGASLHGGFAQDLQDGTTPACPVKGCCAASSPVPARCAARAAASGCPLDRAGAHALMKAPQTLVP
jgi:hypothetical protein